MAFSNLLLPKELPRHSPLTGLPRVRWSAPVSVHLTSLGATLHSNPPPASGAIMANILQVKHGSIRIGRQ